MDYDKVTAAFLNIRDARSQIRKEYEDKDAELKAAQAQLEAAMLDHLNKSGLESARTAAGTFYKTEQLKPAGSDWGAFYDWIKQEDAFDMLERRIKAASIKEYMDANEGAIPPGVSVHREYAVRVRRAS